ncbi:gustatory and odorant receptor 7-like isoform 1 [Anopheles sinensis]|uniref:Gustatory and odorant receptor 7-like isoform 1 n=1 Tax=Anopheles sinensis TaxID=74873 RepID=A0A084WMR1_ANOSI|nr:gustatory and odorant receptor 7-like isoform 1 [Anopheles sinensis]
MRTARVFVFAGPGNGWSWSQAGLFRKTDARSLLNRSSRGAAKGRIERDRRISRRCSVVVNCAGLDGDYCRLRGGAALFFHPLLSTPTLDTRAYMAGKMEKPKRKGKTAHIGQRFAMDSLGPVFGPQSGMVAHSPLLWRQRFPPTHGMSFFPSAEGMVGPFLLRRIDT